MLFSRVVSHSISRPGALKTLALFLALVTASLSYTQTVQVLHAFDGGHYGSSPLGLIPGGQGRLIGAASGGAACKPVTCGVIYELDQKLGEVVIHTFNGNDGSTPIALVPDGVGGVYGVTYVGDAYGCGNVYHVNSAGQFQIIHTFTNNPDGCMGDNLIRGSDGNLYGTTYIGGNNGGGGTVFKLDANGNESVIYAFTGGSDGLLPGASLLEAGGKLYGTTYAGGTGCLLNPGCGVVYEIDQSGKESVLYGFTGTNGDGETPNRLVRDPNGNLFGSTVSGGNVECEGGCGTLFELTQGTVGNWNETVLYRFLGRTDGSHPESLVAFHGNLYGTTYDGTDSGCAGTACGTIFKFDAAGNFATLYTFTNQADGEDPSLSFVQGGTFFGTTFYGGHSYCIDNPGFGCGTVFTFAP